MLVDTARPDIPTPAKIFVTNDLTEKVVGEAIAEAVDIIVTYHPTPFRKQNKFTRADPTARILLACAHHGIAVYAPHTALDCAENGLNDWLASSCGPGSSVPISPDKITPAAGEGRLRTLDEPTALSDVIESVKKHLGLENVRVAIAMDALESSKASSESVAKAAESVLVRTVAVCAGSGASVVGGVDADVYLTGELSHHDCLAANHAGRTVILTDHSNTERGYLPTLASRIKEGMGEDAEVVVTKLDADPLVIV